MRHAAGGLVLAFALGGATGADVLCLKDGRVFEEVKLRRDAGKVLVEFEHGTAAVPEDKVLDCIIAGASDYSPANEEEREKLERGLVPYGGEWMPVSRRDRLLERRLEEQRALVEEMRERRLWRNRLQEESANFAFEATVPRHVFEDYRERCEVYFEAFVDRWRIKKPRGFGKLTVKFYGDKENYMQVTGMSAGVLGFFRYVEPWELNIYYDRLDPRATEEVMYHEVGHYLHKLFDVGFKYPHWPGEALCEYYAAATWNPRTGELELGGILEGRLLEVQRDIEKGDWVTVDELLLGAPDGDYHDYTWGWSLVHFLLEHKKHARSFQKFYAALAQGRDVDRRSTPVGVHQLQSVTGEEVQKAFLKYMKLRGQEDLFEMQAAWHDYVQNELEVTSARGLEEAAALAARLDRNLRARRLYEEAISLGTQNPVAYHRYAEILVELDEDEKAHEAWSKAVELDPLVPEFYIAWGRSLLGSEETRAEGERLLRLARDIEPDNFYLERNLEELLRRSR